MALCNEVARVFKHSRSNLYNSQAESPFCQLLDLWNLSAEALLAFPPHSKKNSAARRWSVILPSKAGAEHTSALSQGLLWNARWCKVVLVGRVGRSALEWAPVCWIKRCWLLYPHLLFWFCRWRHTILTPFILYRSVVFVSVWGWDTVYSAVAWVGLKIGCSGCSNEIYRKRHLSSIVFSTSLIPLKAVSDSQD